MRKKKLLIIIQILIVTLGLSQTILYFYKGAYLGKFTALVSTNRPLFTINTSPLPLVFDSELFFSKIILTFIFADNTKLITELDKDFLNNLPISSHLKLHLARYPMYKSTFTDENKFKVFLCSLNKYPALQNKSKIMQITFNFILLNKKINSNDVSLTIACD